MSSQRSLLQRGSSLTGTVGSAAAGGGVGGGSCLVVRGGAMAGLNWMSEPAEAKRKRIDPLPSSNARAVKAVDGSTPAAIACVCLTVGRAGRIKRGLRSSALIAIRAGEAATTVRSDVAREFAVSMTGDHKTARTITQPTSIVVSAATGCPRRTDAERAIILGPWPVARPLPSAGTRQRDGRDEWYAPTAPCRRAERAGTPETPAARP